MRHKYPYLWSAFPIVLSDQEPAILHNVKEPIGAIHDYIAGHNQNPRVFVWSASVERILTKVAKCKEALDALH